MPKSVPNYLSVAADGSVGAIFPGGVQMPEGGGGVGGVPPESQSIRWVRDSTGAMVANIYAASNGGSGPSYMVVKSAVADTYSGTLQLIAEQGALQAATVNAQAGGQIKTIIDSNGFSSFAKKGAVGPGFGSTDVTVDGPYSVGVPALAQWATGSTLANCPVDKYIGAGAGWIPVGYFVASTGYGNFWSATRAGVNQVRFDFACPWNGGQPAGTFAFFLMGWT